MGVGAERHLHVDEHAGAQFAEGIPERRLDLHVAGRLVNLRVDGRDRADRPGEPHAVRGHADLGADLERRDVLLRHGEVHVDRIHRLQGNDRVAPLQVLAQVHLPEPQHAGERGPDRLALDRGPHLAHVRLRGLGLGREAVVLRLGHHALLEQLGRPREVEIRELALGHRGGQLRPFLIGIEPHQHLARGDLAARVELDPVDQAGQIGAHRDAVHGHDAPDRAQGRRPLVLPRDHCGHGLGRHLERRVLGDRRPGLRDLHQAERGDEQRHHRQHEHHALSHLEPPVSAVSSTWTPRSSISDPRARAISVRARR